MAYTSVGDVSGDYDKFVTLFDALAPSVRALAVYKVDGAQLDTIAYELPKWTWPRLGQLTTRDPERDFVDDIVRGAASLQAIDTDTLADLMTVPRNVVMRPRRRVWGSPRHGSDPRFSNALWVENADVLEFVLDQVRTRLVGETPRHLPTLRIHVLDDIVPLSAVVDRLLEALADDGWDVAITPTAIELVWTPMRLTEGPADHTVQTDSGGLDLLRQRCADRGARFELFYGLARAAG